MDGCLHEMLTKNPPPSNTPSQQPSSKKKGEEDEFGDGYPHHVEARPARDAKEAAFPGLRCVGWRWVDGMLVY